MEAGKRFYIADDDPVQQRITGGILRKYENLFFFDGLSLLQKVLENPPDLIITDIVLPKLSGLAVCRLLKFDVNYRSIPIIVLSGAADVDLDDQVRLVGGDALFVKPCDGNLLLARVEEMLR
jgi:PleD family two-component response regulator